MVHRHSWCSWCRGKCLNTSAVLRCAALCWLCPGEYQESLRAGISTALARLRDYDADTREGLSQELAQAAEFLDQAARLAMASMLQVQQTFALTDGGLWL